MLLSLSAPVTVTATALSRTSIIINWSAATDADAYFLKRYNPSTSAWDIIAQTASCSYTDTNRTANTTYRYIVVAYEVVDGFVYYADNSAEATATTPLYCYAPASISAIATGRTSVSVSWSAAAGAEAYFLKRYNPSTSSWDIIAQTASCSFSDTGRTANTNYRYYVVAYVILDGTVRFADNSAEASATTPLYCYPPASVSATASSPVSVTVNWSAAAGAEGYFLKRYNTSTSSWDIIAQTTGLSYTDNSRSPGTEYRYHVVAYVVLGGVTRYADVSTEASVTTPRYVYAPTTVSVSAVSAYTAKVTWNAATGAEGYFVKRYNTSTSTWDIVNQTAGLSYTDITCSPSTNYRYHVVAYRVVSGTTHYAPVSSEASLTMPSFGSAPASISASASATSIALTWSAATGANGYFVERYNSSTSSWDIIGQTSATSYTDKSLSISTNYRYFVAPYATGTTTHFATQSAEASATTFVVSGPPSMMAYAVGRSEITVHWDMGDNADGYVLRRATSSGGPFTNIYTTTNRYYTDTGRTAGTTYYYDVVAYKVISGTTYYATPLCTASAAPESSVASYSTLGYNNNRVVGLDANGRAFAPVDSYMSNRSVGVMYWPWFGTGSPQFDGIYDNSVILSQTNGFNKLFYQNTYDSPANAPHYWGEPLWGYYHSRDPYIIRKHMELLTAAGVDFIFFDTTNAWTYTDAVIDIMKVIDEMQSEGWNPPKIVYYTHSKSLDTLRSIYADVYKKNLYPSTWYNEGGKPVVIAYTTVAEDLAEAAQRGDYNYNPAPLSSEILNFFTFKKPQWPTDSFYSNGFPWLELTYPQPMHNNTMNVSVGSYPLMPYSFSITRGYTNWGRGYNVATQSNNYADVFTGRFFQSSWDTVLNASTKPTIVTINGWNQWVASKAWYDGEYTFCDVANMEYSTDIEMMKGGYEDTYYQLLAKNIRAYKGNAAGSTNYTTKTIDITGNINQWDDVNAVFRDMGVTNYGRNYTNVAGTGTYVQDAPRNNIQEVRVTKDSTYIYFYIRCGNTITAPTGTKWMNIFIGTGTPSSKGWQGYNYVVNRVINGTTGSVEALSSNYTGTSTGSTLINRNGSVLQVRIPRSALGLGSSDNTFYFKVADDVTSPADIMNFYTTGSCLPMGRLSFQYNN